jgi:hypothetical protein
MAIDRYNHTCATIHYLEYAPSTPVASHPGHYVFTIYTMVVYVLKSEVDGQEVVM